MPNERRPRRSPGLLFVRVLLPAGILLAAVVVAIVGPRELAPGLVVAALFVVAADWLIRLGISSQYDRDGEQQRRSRFRRTGRWPEDDPPRQTPPDRDPHR